MPTTFLLESPPFSVTVWIVQMIAYHGLALWFEWLDRTGRLRRFKCRSLERKTYRELLPSVLANQFLLLLPAMMLLQGLGLAFTVASHLTPLAMLAGVIGLTVGHDIVQYIGHRFVLHHPLLARRLGHTIHHSTTASRAVSACYMSRADYALEIVCPYLVPLALIGGGGSDLFFHSLVVTAGAFGGLYEHSGYDFSRALGSNVRPRFAFGSLLSSEAHGAHHSRGNVSFSDGFGSSNICDTLLGTRWDLVRRRESL